MERVTVSMPARVRESAARFAEEDGLSFSAFITSAVEDWIRGRLLDQWLEEQAAERGGWDEEEMKRLAAEIGIPYLPPGRPGRRLPEEAK